MNFESVPARSLDAWNRTVRRSPIVRLAALAVAALLAVHWMNSRITILRANQDAAHPIVPSTYYVFHGMAQALRDGRVGQVDLAALQRYERLHDLWAPYERLPPDAEHVWVNYYTLDIGYAFIVEAARLAFPSLPDNHLRALALQLVADAATVWFVWFLFARWNPVLGVVAAYLYISNSVFQGLVSFPFYYYWDIPLTFVVLGSLLIAWHDPREAKVWLVLAGLCLGAGVWLRGSWWPIAGVVLAFAWYNPATRRCVLVPVLVFAVVAAPQVIRSSRARGHLTLSTRTVWHVALVGLGYYPNPYGLAPKDEVVFELTKNKYHVPFRTEDYLLHDQAAKTEFFAILRRDPMFVVRSIVGRLLESLRGSTTLQSYRWLSNGLYRTLCALGLAAMVWRGGDRRLLGLAAAGTYAIYVGLTCLFYFVGLAYDNVTQVTLFVLFMGLLDAAIYLTGRAVAPAVQPAAAAAI
jgi:hypothetical protein